MMRRACFVLFAAFALVGFRHLERRPPFGIVAGYTFNHADARDVSLRGRDCTLAGDASVSSGVLNLDGTGDYAEAADHSDFSFTDGAGTDRPFSVCGWIYHDGAVGSSFPDLARKYDGGAEWILRASNGGFGMRFFIYSGGSGSVYIGRSYSSGPPESTWYHLAGTYDGSESASGVKIYLNGSRVDDGSVSHGSFSGMSNTASPLRAGVSLNGKADDVMFFNRELTATEIAQIYHAGRTP